MESYGLHRLRFVRICVSRILTACSPSGGQRLALVTLQATSSTPPSRKPSTTSGWCRMRMLSRSPSTRYRGQSSLQPLASPRSIWTQERPPAIPDRISSLRWPGGCNSCLSQVGRAHKFAWALESIVRADLELGFFQGVKPHERFYENSRNILQLTLLKRHFERGLFDPWSQLFCNEPFC